MIFPVFVQFPMAQSQFDPQRYPVDRRWKVAVNSTCFQGKSKPDHFIGIRLLR